MLLLKEKPLQYYKLLCRLASESRAADRLTLQVKNHKTRGLGSGIFDQKICQDLPPPPTPFDIDGRNKNLAFIDTQSNV